jgi:hypothetical protein
MAEVKSEQKVKKADVDLLMETIKTIESLVPMLERLRDARAYAESGQDEYRRGRLFQFRRMKKERPLDPVYWDFHEEKQLMAERSHAGQEEG